MEDRYALRTHLFVPSNLFARMACAPGEIAADIMCQGAACDSAETPPPSTPACEDCEPLCGDLDCTLDEDCTTCPEDCGVCPPSCGNGSCDSGESCSTCASDCGACSPDSVTVAWDPPLFNEDGSPLTDLAGYRLYVDTQTPVDRGRSTVIDAGMVSQYTLELPAGTHHVAATACDREQNESGLSNEIAITVP